MYTFEDGYYIKTIITFDIKNYKEVKEIDNAADPYVDAVMTVAVETDGVNYKKNVSIDYFEIEYLAKAFKKLIEGEMKEYYRWDHIESDLEFCFIPKENHVYVHLSFDESINHYSGFFFEMYGEEINSFYDYLIQDVGVIIED